MRIGVGMGPARRSCQTAPSVPRAPAPPRVVPRTPRSSQSGEEAEEKTARRGARAISPIAGERSGLRAARRSATLGAMELATDRARLIELLAARSFRYQPAAPFRLASGRTSPYYFNCKTTLYHPEGLVVVGRCLFAVVAPLGVAAIGGLTLGADPLAFACAYCSEVQGNPIEPFVVRKQAKDHGTCLPIEGNVVAGDRVVVVDDVITTGGSALKAIAACRAARLEVVHCCVVVDRQEGGREAIEAAGVAVTALATRTEVMAVRTATPPPPRHDR